MGRDARWHVEAPRDEEGARHVRPLRHDQHRFDIDPVPHVLCNGFTREETEDALIELHYLGIENVLAIRGDGERRDPPDHRTVNANALELVGQIAAMNRGEYLEDLEEATPTDFCLGVRATPRSTRRRPTWSAISRS